jgi:hypothetical protein
MSEIQKKPVGRPPVHSTPITVRAHPSLLGAIDSFASDQPDKPSRPEAIRRLLRDHLIGLGHLKDEE